MKQTDHYHVTPPFQHCPLTNMPSSVMFNMNGNGEDGGGEIIALTFKTEWDKLAEVSKIPCD